VHEHRVGVEAVGLPDPPRFLVAELVAVAPVRKPLMAMRSRVASTTSSAKFVRLTRMSRW
jgi:hypothetical protein